MTEVPDTVDDAIDPLSSPTTDEVFEATRPFSSREIASSAVSRGGGGGNGGPQVRMTTLTTDANTFVSPEHVFDLGEGAHAVLVTIVGTTLTPDGETFGNDAGEIYGHVLVETSADQAANTWVSATVQKDVSHYVPAAVANVFEVQITGTPADRIILSARYVRVTASIQSNDTGELYAGANNPQAVIDVTVTS